MSTTKPKVAIVSTSIAKFLEDTTYGQWTWQGDVFIAGDVNTPHTFERDCKEAGNVGSITYLDPGKQSRWSFSDVIGWQSVQRRNAAVMHAYVESKYDYVLTIDDDNGPIDGDHVKKLIDNVLTPQDFEVVFSPDGWVNLGNFVRPKTVQRGFPLWFAKSDYQYTVQTFDDPLPIVVAQSQVVGDPDCDAFTRLATRPRTQSVGRSVVVDPREGWAPFNSQATLWSVEWAPFIACLPDVGRYDDIWASLIAQRVMAARGVGLYAGTPAVYQRRNRHDLNVDLHQEYHGTLWTRKFVEQLTAVPDHQLTDVPLPEAYRVIAGALEKVLPWRAYEFMVLWAKEWKNNLR